MSNSTISDRVLSCLQRNGVNIDNIDGISSVEFIGIVLELEKEFDIAFPDEYLYPTFFSSFENLCKRRRLQPSFSNCSIYSGELSIAGYGSCYLISQGCYDF